MDFCSIYSSKAIEKNSSISSFDISFAGLTTLNPKNGASVFHQKLLGI
jgi:hypothetical protein